MTETYKFLYSGENIQVFSASSALFPSHPLSVHNACMAIDRTDNDLIALSPIKEMELAAAKIPGAISLAQGIPSFKTPQVIKDFVIEKINSGLCDKYSLTIGLQELREELSLALEKEGFRYDPDTEILCTAGSLEAISATLMACTNPGDEVILVSPSYAAYRSAIQLAGCTPRYAELDEDNNFDFKVETIERAITKKTKVILYPTPNNPTGTLFSEAKTRQVVELALRNRLTILTDEVYKDFYYSDDKHFSPAAIPEARDSLIRVLSFSKAYAMTGWRIGSLHGPAKIVKRIVKYHDPMVSCAPVVSQYAGIAALRYGEQFLAEFRAEFKRRRDFTVSYLDTLSHVLDYQLPKATYFVFPRIKDSVPYAHDSKKFCYDVLEKAELALVPGIAFGPSGEQHFRLSFGKELSEIEAGLGRLTDYFSLRTRRSSPVGVTKFPTQPKTPPLTRQLAQKLLGICARYYLQRNQPTIIGIAGIKGKTVFKRQVEDLLKKQFKVRSNILSYNTALGLPLSVLSIRPPRTWTDKLLLPFQMIRQSLRANSERILILEYGISSLDDARALLQIAKPNWLIVTDLTMVDPNLDRADLFEGIKLLCGAVGSNLVIWPRESGLEGLDPALAFESTGLTNGTLKSNRNSYQITKELIGQSAQQAELAAVILGEQLGISRYNIEEHLR